MFQVEIDNYYELLALHRAIMSAKFTENPLLPEVQGSPYVAKLSFKVFDLLVNAAAIAGKTNEVEKWRQWQVADIDREETQLLLVRLNCASIKNMTNDDRRSFIENFMAPLILDQELADKLVFQQS